MSVGEVYKMHAHNLFTW